MSHVRVERRLQIQTRCDRLSAQIQLMSLLFEGSPQTMWRAMHAGISFRGFLWSLRHWLEMGPSEQLHLYSGFASITDILIPDGFP